jgi:hypothetical protein
VLQNNNLRLFEDILRDFDSHGILQDFILIGSWALRVYKEHFNDDPQIPIVATQDVDLLIPNPPKKSHQVDVPKLLEKHGLDILTDCSGQKIKFVCEEIEVEFLYVEQGRSKGGAMKIPDLKITATPLRYMHFIQTYSTFMTYQGLQVKVPEPEVFVLLKYLLIIERTGKYITKIAKDISTAKDLEFFLLEQGSQDRFIEYFQSMSKSWQKKLMPILREHDSELIPLFE